MMTVQHFDAPLAAATCAIVYVAAPGVAVGIVVPDGMAIPDGMLIGVGVGDVVETVGALDLLHPAATNTTKPASATIFFIKNTGC